MRIEHLGISISAPIDMGNWYSRHLGFEVIRRGGNNQDGVSFIVDESGKTILELFKLPDVPALDVKNFNPIQLHIAIDCENPYELAMKLVQAGASFVGEAPRNEYEGEKYLVRDPWGIVLQLVNRKRKLRD